MANRVSMYKLREFFKTKLLSVSLTMVLSVNILQCSPCYRNCVLFYSTTCSRKFRLFMECIVFVTVHGTVFLLSTVKEWPYFSFHFHDFRTFEKKKNCTNVIFYNKTLSSTRIRLLSDRCTLLSSSPSK